MPTLKSDCTFSLHSIRMVGKPPVLSESNLSDNERKMYKINKEHLEQLRIETEHIGVSSLTGDKNRLR